MKTILLDDEPFALKFLTRLCQQIPELFICAVFQNPEEALAYLAKNPIDLVISDIEMPGLNGMEVVRRLRETQRDIGVIFVTGYEEYALSAFQLQAVAYLLKPCSLEDLQNAVRRAARLRPPGRRLSIQTFGHFSVSLDGAPLRFANSKAKELLALLIDRQGSVVPMAQAIDLLWEDRIYDDAVKRLYRKAVSYLHQLLDGTAFFVSDRGSCHIVPDKADCDYFNLSRDLTAAARDYDGEYLTEYSWAEATNGKIWRILNEFREKQLE